MEYVLETRISDEFRFFPPRQFVWSENCLEFPYKYPLHVRLGRSFRTDPCIAKKNILGKVEEDRRKKDVERAREDRGKEGNLSASLISHPSYSLVASLTIQGLKPCPGHLKESFEVDKSRPLAWSTCDPFRWFSKREIFMPAHTRKWVRLYS